MDVTIDFTAGQSRIATLFLHICTFAFVAAT
jgi:hypothetical protein